MKVPIAGRVAEIKKLIDALIGDRKIPWDQCCDALEDIEDHAGEWARQIRSEHD